MIAPLRGVLGSLAVVIAFGGCSKLYVIPVHFDDHTTVSGQLIVINHTGAPFDLTRIDPCTTKVDPPGAKTVEAATSVAFSVHAYTITATSTTCTDSSTCPNAAPSFLASYTDYVSPEGPKTVLTVGEGVLEIDWRPVAARMFEPWRADATGGLRPGRPTYAVTIDGLADGDIFEASAVLTCSDARDLGITAEVPECR